ncbi:MAG: hypothetical protein NTZ73_01865 [Candidatus Diapherotrites archaeon]|nr:hypothetical protein [Candidatus Diapherotrites archaeon]
MVQKSGGFSKKFSLKQRSLERLVHHNSSFLDGERTSHHSLVKIVLVFLGGIMFGAISIQAGLPKSQIFIYLQIALMVSIMALLLDIRRIILAL